MKYHTVIYTNWESVVKTIFPGAAFNCTVNCGRTYCLGGRCYMWSYRRVFRIISICFSSFLLSRSFRPIAITYSYVSCLLVFLSDAYISQIRKPYLRVLRWVEESTTIGGSHCCAVAAFVKSFVFSTHRTPWEKFDGIHYLLFGKRHNEVRSLKSSKLLKLGGIMKKSLK